MKRPISESYLLTLAVCLSPIVRCHYQPYGENVALKKPANQSSTYSENGFMFVASLGVDGNISTNFYRDKTCSHTSTGSTYAWWTVDLNGFFFIKFIRIYQLIKQNTYNRLDGSTMDVRVEDSTWQQIQFNSNWPPEIFDVNVTLEKRISAIKLNNTKLSMFTPEAFISICELEAYKVIECSSYSIGNGNINVVQHGDSNQTFTYGTKLNVTCHEGYRMSDDGIVTNEAESILECNVTGNWSRNLRCSVIDCGLPLNIPGNCTVMFSTGLAGNTSYNATLTVRCNEGFNYTLPGNETIRCGKEGRWPDILGLCKVIDCGRPLHIPGNSTIHSSTGLAGNTSYNATLTVRCNKGFNYTLTGKETIRCGTEGKWNGILGRCEAIHCGLRPTSPSNSVLIVSSGIDSDTSYNATMTVVCNEGYNYTSPGSETARCRDDGVWETIVGNCKAIHCGLRPTSPSNSVLIISPGIDGDTSYNATMTVVCNEGYNYTSPGSETARCRDDGVWETIVGNCKVIECFIIFSIVNGEIKVKSTGVDGKNNTYGVKLYVECNSGFASNLLEITCLDSGLSSHPVCSAVPNPTNLIAAIIGSVVAFITALVVGIVIFMRRRKKNKDDATRNFDQIDESKVGGNINHAEMDFDKGIRNKKRNKIPDDPTIAHKVIASGHRLEVKEEMSAYEIVEDFDMENFNSKSIGLDTNAIEPYETLQMDNIATSEYDELKFERESSLKRTKKNDTYQNMQPGD